MNTPNLPPKLPGRLLPPNVGVPAHSKLLFSAMDGSGQLLARSPGPPATHRMGPQCSNGFRERHVPEFVNVGSVHQALTRVQDVVLNDKEAAKRNNKEGCVLRDSPQQAMCWPGAVWGADLSLHGVRACSLHGPPELEWKAAPTAVA